MREWGGSRSEGWKQLVKIDERMDGKHLLTALDLDLAMAVHLLRTSKIGDEWRDTCSNIALKIET